MREGNSTVTHEVYQLLCELKLLLLATGSGTVESGTHDSVLRLLVALRKYSKFFNMDDVCELSAEMERRWRTIVPGEAKREVVDSTFTIADQLAAQLLAAAPGHPEMPSD